MIHGIELGRKYELVKKSTVVGRSARADIQVDQESVSRLHARLTHQGARISVRDLGSTNGSYVNDEMIADDLNLRNGDLLKIGRTIFKFIAGGNIESAYHDEIYRLTTVDGLTQIFNRRYFEDALEREVSRCHRYHRQLSLTMIDIDQFKRVNDDFGHMAGDHVIKGVAELIKARIRKEDILARYGGEEFALLLPEIDVAGAVSLANKVRKIVEKHVFKFDGQNIPLTISAGVAGLTSPKLEVSDLVRTADAQLYLAKRGGRNRVCSEKNAN